jgi:hypothetical protein
MGRTEAVFGAHSNPLRNLSTTDSPERALTMKTMKMNGKLTMWTLLAVMVAIPAFLAAQAPAPASTPPVPAPAAVPAPVPPVPAVAPAPTSVTVTPASATPAGTTPASVTVTPANPAAASVTVVTPPAAAPGDSMTVVQLSALLDSAKTAADHEQIAKHYDSEAVLLESAADDHLKLATQYKDTASLKGSLHPTSKEASAHCLALADGLRSAAKEARTMAADHRAVAVEMKP